MAAPISPYGSFKLMTEIMLRDGHGSRPQPRYLALLQRAAADPECRSGQSTKNSTQLIKVAVEAALGLRPKLDIYGTDHPTRLHPRQRSRPCAFRRVALLARGWCLTDA